LSSFWGPPPPAQNKLTENLSLHIEKIAVKRNINVSSKLEQINQSFVFAEN
jgi:hypothetical protein